METGAYFRLFQALANELPRRPHQGLIFWWEDFEHFACLQCGSSCNRPWKIHVSQAELEKWGLQWAELMQQPLETLVVLESPDLPNRYASLAKQADQRSCVFLDSELLCRIHSALGSSAKPKICQKYPITATRMDHGHYQSQGLAGSCVSVGQNLSLSKTLKYQWVQLEPDAPEPLLPLIRSKYLGWDAWLCLTGFQLDQLLQPAQQQNWFWTQSQCLGHLLRGPAHWQARELTSALSQFQPQLPPAPLPPQALLPLLNWLCEQLLQRHSALHPLMGWLQSWKDSSDWPEITPTEKQLIHTYLQAWMQKQILMQNALIQGQLDLLHQLLAWGLQALLIQLWALYERTGHVGSLRQADLGLAQNQISAYLIQDFSGVSLQRIQATRPEICLVQLGLLARVDWPSRL